MAAAPQAGEGLRDPAAGLRGRCSESLAGLARAKEDVGRLGWRSIARSSSLFVAAGAVGSAAFGFYDGLWVPLLRDGQTAAEAAAVGAGLLPERLVDWAAQRLACGEAWPEAWFEIR